MIFMTGETGSRKFLSTMEELGIGRIFTQSIRQPYDGEKWGFDNGAYSCWQNGHHWDGEKYLERLEKAYKLPKPFLAVIPDKPTMPDSMDFSLHWLDELPDDWDWYFCLQDGMDFYQVRDYVCADERVKGLFLGGTHPFKETMGERYLKLAKDTNKRFHIGRASSIQRIVNAYDLGCKHDMDHKMSCDSAFFLWNKTRFNAVCKLVENNFKTSQMRLIDSYVISHEVQ